MLTHDEILQQVNDYFAQHPITRSPEGLYSPVQYTLDMGGKRVRPSLMMLACNIYTDHPEVCLPQACALETYHNFTLLHDDLMDNADYRRGRLTVHRCWNANTAILSGDAMQVIAFRDMARCEADKVQPIIELFTRTALEVCEGQQYDMEFERRQDVTEQEYMEMIRLKTSVLIACALKMGAILGNAPAADAEQLYRFGEQLGLAFQLQDDYLDVYGDPTVFGKAIGGDILADKKTFMLINALLMADERQYAELTQWIGNRQCDNKQKIKAVTQIYNEIGIDRLAQEKIANIFAQARALLDELPVADERKTQLALYADYMLQRQK